MAFDTNWLNSVYQQNLGRSADQGGIDYWKSQYDTLGKSGIEWNIKQSEDAKKYLASQKSSTSNGLINSGRNNAKPATTSRPNQTFQLNQGSSSTPSSTAYQTGFDQSRLNQIYQQQFGRDADAAGVDYWRQQYDTLGMDGIEWNIKQQTDKQGGTQAGGGKATYQDAKAALKAAGKSTDTNSVLQYMSSVNSGQTTLGGGNAGQGGATADRDRINQIYQQALGRDADAAGADYWLSQLGTLGWDGIAANIRQGAEYQSGSPPRFTPTSVQPSQAVVSQLNDLLVSNSPLMQRAATQGMQYANSRGLLNSSMAAGAAQGAMIDRALPIAQQDAQTQFQAAQADAAYQRQRHLNEQSYGFDMGRMQQQFNNEMQRMGYAYELDQRNVPQNYAANISAQTLQNVQAIQADPNLEPAAKQAAIKNAIDMANANLTWAEAFYNTPMPALRTPGAA